MVKRKTTESKKALDNWFKENVIVLGSDDAESDVNKIKTALEKEFGIDESPVKKEKKDGRTSKIAFFYRADRCHT